MNSFPEVVSRWLDHWMQKLVPLSPTYLQDSNQLCEELAALGPLPPNVKLFTADAISMYTNINIQDGLNIFRTWFTKYATEIPENFPTQLFLQILEIVMTRNIFQFDDMDFLQKRGPAMGTSSACMYATLYQALYKHRDLTPNWELYLEMLRQFIDNMYGMWDDINAEAWKGFNFVLAQI